MNSTYVISAEAVNWLNEMRRHAQLPPISEFGQVVASVIYRALGPLYNQHRRIHYAEWNCVSYIEILANKGLATYDFDHLTQLVIQCHDACIRMEIDNGGPHQLKLRFHPRSGREGRNSERHPTIEDAIIRARTGRYPQQQGVGL